MASRIIAAFATLALAGLVAAGCSDSDLDGTQTPTTAATAESPTPASTSTATDGPNVIDDVRDILAGLDTAIFRAEYDLEASSLGDLAGTLTLANRPPGRLLAYDGTTPLGDGQVAIVEDGERSFFCLAFGAEANCSRSAGDGPLGALLPADLSVDQLVSEIVEAADTTAREVDGREIAGEDARCFALAGASATGTLCLADSGVPLLVDGQLQGGRWVIAATSLDEPEDADFEPPFPLR